MGINLLSEKPQLNIRGAGAGFIFFISRHLRRKNIKHEKKSIYHLYCGKK